MPLKQTVANTAATSLRRVERLVRPPARSTGGTVLILEYLLPLGCCVHLTPVYAAIKDARPQIVVVVATRGLAASLLRHNPHIDHLIQTPDALIDTLGTARALRDELRARRLNPTLILTGASDRRTRIALPALLAAPAIRGGFTLLPGLYHQPLPYDPTRSLIANNLRLAGLLGCPETHREPEVFFSAADAAHAQALAGEANPEGKPLLILVTQTSGGQATGWHAERFSAVACYAADELGCAVAYVGTATDAEPIAALQAATGLGVSLAGRTTVTQLASVLAQADLVVSLDTGTMHVARAVGTPMVVIGPSWQRPIEWMPLNLPHIRILRGPDRDTIPAGYRLDEVSVEAVEEALQDLLTSHPPSAASRAARLAASLSTTDHIG